MTIRNFRDVQPGHPVSASELNRLAAEVEKATNFTGSNVSYGVGGLNIAEEQEDSFWARLGANDGLTPAAHAWTKLQENADGTFSDDDQNITGSTTVNPAYSIDGTAAPVGSRVRLLPAQTGDYFLYDPGMSGGTGSSLEVKEADGAPDVLSITVIIVDQATGLAIESSAAGTVTLQNLSASSTQVGVVNLADQTLGDGDKTFSKDAVFHANLVDPTSVLYGVRWILFAGSVGDLSVRAATVAIAGVTSSSMTFTLPQVNAADATTAATMRLVNGSGTTYLELRCDSGLPTFHVVRSDGTFIGTDGDNITSGNFRSGLYVGPGASMGGLSAAQASEVMGIISLRA